MHPASSFDVRSDANALQKAMKGLGTDEKALINILCHRSRSQRTAINHSFKSAFGKVNQLPDRDMQQFAISIL